MTKQSQHTAGLTDRQMRTLAELNEHPGEFRRGYGKSAAVLYRLKLAKRKFVGVTSDLKYAITDSGRAALASTKAKPE